MTNPSGRKGSTFERQVADYLAKTFPMADRRVKTGAKDKGDIGGIPGWTLELKATKTMNLSAAVREAHVEAVNAGTKWFAAVVKKPRAHTDQAYVVMPLWLWTELVSQ